MMLLWTTLLLACLKIVDGLLVPPAVREDFHLGDFIEHHQHQWSKREQQMVLRPKERLVPVTLGVMSKCPDAEICESVFDSTLSRVSHLVDLRMAYIGTFNSSLSPYGVECKHGPSECAGNVQQLCVRAHASGLREWWNFIQCNNYGKLDKVGDLSLARQCARVIGKDWERDFSECYTGKEGRRLLRQSVSLAQDLNIKKSCSILISDRLVCVHDGSWKDCPDGHEASDFERLVRQEYERLNP